MHITLTDILRCLAGLVAGGLIGVGFGLLQSAALRRNHRLEQTGQLKSGWAVMPGSMRRVAYLMIALALVQILCPMLFVNGTQWWVSAGVVIGYGAMLARQLCASKP